MKRFIEGEDRAQITLLRGIRAAASAAPVLRPLHAEVGLQLSFTSGPTGSQLRIDNRRDNAHAVPATSTRRRSTPS